MQHDFIIAISERFIVDYSNAQALHTSAISNQPVVDLRNNQCSIFILQTNNLFQLYRQPLTLNLMLDGISMSVESVTLRAVKAGNNWQFSAKDESTAATSLPNMLEHPTLVPELRKLFASLFFPLVQLPNIKPVLFILESELHREFIESQCVALSQNARFAPLFSNTKHVIIRHDDDLRGYAFFYSLFNAIRNDLRFLLIEQPTTATECHFNNDAFTYTVTKDIRDDKSFDGIAMLYGDSGAQSDPRIIFTNHTHLSALALLGYIRWKLHGDAYESYSEEMLEQHIQKLTHELSVWQSLKTRITNLITSLGQH